ncbi:MAG: hypothetical protein JRC88_07245 [Deltaproteobacteria bacterium]|nr:hypothetical protein [Deltaproteobacteria bacterium]
MAKYAFTDNGLQILKDRAFSKKLTPYRRDVFRQIIEKAKDDILEDPNKEEIKSYLRG